jgi:hypothetical protein
MSITQRRTLAVRALATGLVAAVIVDELSLGLAPLLVKELMGRLVELRAEFNLRRWCDGADEIIATSDLELPPFVADRPHPPLGDDHLAEAWQVGAGVSLLLDA